MKGVVFTEFLEMVEDRFGLELVDQIVQKSALPSGGAYTAVGTYDHDELLKLVVSLSDAIDTPVPDLVRAFAHHLFQSFAKAYPFALEGMTSSIELLQNVEGVIHVEVKKLYGDAELPKIEFQHLGDDCWELTYRSSRPLADLCEGLIEACGDHFGEEIHLEREDLQVETGAESRFVLQVTTRENACKNFLS